MKTDSVESQKHTANVMKVKELKIDIFRNLENIVIPLAPQLTAVAGHNGVSKTSILGLIAHVFNFDLKYRDVSGAPFAAKYSEIFKLSPTFDKAGKHKYQIVFEGNKQHVSVLSTIRTEGGKTKGIRFKIIKSMEGRGKIKMPVIYLGMRRLFPIAQEKKVEKNALNPLTEEEQIFYKKFHNDVLLMLDEEINPVRIVSKNKDYFSPSTVKYDHFGISAGQDNLGQIISAIISFHRLKTVLGNNYPGGLIFIDEIDATLFPGAQLKLVDRLFQEAKDLNLQIVFTTHSTDVIDQVYKGVKKGSSRLIYLDKNRSKIKVNIDISPQKIREDIRADLPNIEMVTKNKKKLYCEDSAAKDFISCLLSSRNKKKTKIAISDMGWVQLQKAFNKFSEIKECIIVVDGDANPSETRIIKLPGKKAPELVIFDFLRNLHEDNAFWGDTQIGGITKKACFNSCVDNTNTDKVKEWYKSMIKCLKQPWSLWCKDNEKLVDEFNKKIEKVI